MQSLRYAARAIQIAEEFADEDWEGQFLERLEHAKSNLPHFGTGAGVYRRLVKPSVVRMERIANHYAISSLFEEMPKQARIFSFIADRLDYLRIMESMRRQGTAPHGLARTRYPRWFLRLLGCVYFCAFASLVPQIVGLVGRDGILPAGPSDATTRAG